MLLLPLLLCFLLICLLSTIHDKDDYTLSFDTVSLYNFRLKVVLYIGLWPLLCSRHAKRFFYFLFYLNHCVCSVLTTHLINEHDDDDAHRWTGESKKDFYLTCTRKGNR